MKTPHAPSSRRGGNLGTFISRLNVFFFSVDGISLAGLSIHELEFLSAHFNFKLKVCKLKLPIISFVDRAIAISGTHKV